MLIFRSGNVLKKAPGVTPGVTVSKGVRNMAKKKKRITKRSSAK